MDLSNVKTSSATLLTTNIVSTLESLEARPWSPSPMQERADWYAQKAPHKLPALHSLLQLRSYGLPGSKVWRRESKSLRITDAS